MKLLEKINLLLDAKIQAIVPPSPRERVSPLDQAEAQRLAEIRQALRDVESLKQDLIQQLQSKRNSVAQTDKPTLVQKVDKQVAELTERPEIVNLEASLAALEEHLALLKAEADQRGQAADAILQGKKEPTPPLQLPASEFEIIEDDAKLAARKARLAG